MVFALLNMFFVHYTFIVHSYGTVEFICKAKPLEEIESCTCMDVLISVSLSRGEFSVCHQ